MITFLPMQEEKDEILEKVEETEEEKIQKIYELGFLVSPEISEEKLPEFVSEIKIKLEEVGGLFISEEYPKMKPLSYKIFRKKDNKKTSFEQAYFGWLKFEIGASEISGIKNYLEGNKSILRFLIIKTVRDNTLYSSKFSLKREKEKSARKEPKGEEMTESTKEEIDKSIEELVVS